MYHFLNNTVKWSLIDFGWQINTCIMKSSFKLQIFHFPAGKIKLIKKFFFFLRVLYMHVLTEFSANICIDFFESFRCQLHNCFDGSLSNMCLPVHIIISFPGDIVFLIWGLKTCWTKYLNRDFKLGRKVCVYLKF